MIDLKLTEAFDNDVIFVNEFLTAERKWVFNFCDNWENQHKTVDKTLNSSRQQERIKTSFKKKVHCRLSRQLMSLRCKNRFRTRKSRTINQTQTKKMSRRKIENVYAWRCIYLKNASIYANRHNQANEKRIKRFEMKCVKD